MAYGAFYRVAAESGNASLVSCGDAGRFFTISRNHAKISLGANSPYCLLCDRRFLFFLDHSRMDAERLHSADRLGQPWGWLTWGIPVVAALLAVIGLGGIARGDELSQAGTLYGKQIVWLILAGLSFFIGIKTTPRFLQTYASLLFVASVLLLGLVFVFPARWGARRWIPLGILFFQPSELAKVATILALARYLVTSQTYRTLRGLIIPFLLTLLPLGLILKEPDLGTSLLFLPVLYAMLFAAGARLRHLLFVALMGVIVSPVFWNAISAEQRSRITAIFQQQDGRTPVVGKADGYHLHQSKQVLSLGGFAGSQWQGTRLTDPAAYYLPACRTDFILCMVGERWGWIGSCTVLTLYMVLFGAGLRVAARTRDPFCRLVAVGITVLMAAQTVINTGMTVGLLPITGITLPLLSYGGSSLLFTGFCLGTLVNISRQTAGMFETEPFAFRGTRRLNPINVERLSLQMTDQRSVR